MNPPKDLIKYFFTSEKVNYNCLCLVSFLDQHLLHMVDVSYSQSYECKEISIQQSSNNILTSDTKLIF